MPQQAHFAQSLWHACCSVWPFISAPQALLVDHTWHLSEGDAPQPASQVSVGVQVPAQLAFAQSLWHARCSVWPYTSAPQTLLVAHTWHLSEGDAPQSATQLSAPDVVLPEYVMRPGSTGASAATCGTVAKVSARGVASAYAFPSGGGRPLAPTASSRSTRILRCGDGFLLACEAIAE